MAMKNDDQLASKEDLHEAIEDFKVAVISEDKNLMAECLTAALIVWLAVKLGLSEAQSIRVLNFIGRQSSEALSKTKTDFFIELKTPGQ